MVRYAQYCLYHRDLGRWNGSAATQPPMYSYYEVNSIGHETRSTLQSFGKGLWINPRASFKCPYDRACRTHRLHSLFSVRKNVDQGTMDVLIHSDILLESVGQFLGTFLSTLPVNHPDVGSHAPAWGERLDALLLWRFKDSLKRWCKSLHEDRLWRSFALLPYGFLEETCMFEDQNGNISRGPANKRGTITMQSLEGAGLDTLNEGMLREFIRVANQHNGFNETFADFLNRPFIRNYSTNITILAAAVENCWGQTVLNLLALGADPNSTWGYCTPLQAAMACPFPTRTKWRWTLITQADRHRAVVEALREGRKDVLESLIALDSTSVEDLFAIAATEGDVVLLDALLDHSAGKSFHGEDVDSEDLDSDLDSLQDDCWYDVSESMSSHTSEDNCVAIPDTYFDAWSDIDTSVRDGEEPNQLSTEACDDPPETPLACRPYQQHPVRLLSKLLMLAVRHSRLSVVRSLIWWHGAQIDNHTLAKAAETASDAVVEELFVHGIADSIVHAAKDTLLKTRSHASLLACRRLLHPHIGTNHLRNYFLAEIRVQFMIQHWRILEISHKLARSEKHARNSANRAPRISASWRAALHMGIRAMRRVSRGLLLDDVNQVLIMIALAKSMRNADPSLLAMLSEEDLNKDISRWQCMFQHSTTALEAYQHAIHEIWDLDLQNLPPEDGRDAECIHLFRDALSLFVPGWMEAAPHREHSYKGDSQSTATMLGATPCELSDVIIEPMLKPPDTLWFSNPPEGLQKAYKKVALFKGHVRDQELQKNFLPMPQTTKSLTATAQQRLLVWLMTGAIVACIAAFFLVTGWIRPKGVPLLLPHEPLTSVYARTSLVHAACHLSSCIQSELQVKIQDELSGSAKTSIQRGTVTNFQGLVSYLTGYNSLSTYNTSISCLLSHETIDQLRMWRASYVAQFCYSTIMTYLGHSRDFRVESIVPRRLKPMTLSEYSVHLDAALSQTDRTVEDETDSAYRSMTPLTSDQLSSSTTQADTSVVPESVPTDSPSQPRSNSTARPQSRQPKQCDICGQIFKGGTPALGKHKRTQHAQQARVEQGRFACSSECGKSYLTRYQLEEHQRRDHKVIMRKRRYNKCKTDVEVDDSSERKRARVEVV